MGDLSGKEVEVIEVNGDGACLFRCLSHIIFKDCSNDLKLLRERFRGLGYNIDDFLVDYLDISECFIYDDYKLDNELEEELARAIQLLILDYVKKNAKEKIVLDMTLEDLIMMCHEIDLETYIKNYQTFAGDDMNEYVIGKKGKRRKVEILRWGGVPELNCFCRMFGCEIRVYIPQILKRGKWVVTERMGGKIKLKEVDRIGNNEPVYLLLLRTCNGEYHYDYISKKSDLKVK